MKQHQRENGYSIKKIFHQLNVFGFLHRTFVRIIYQYQIISIFSSNCLKKLSKVFSRKDVEKLYSGNYCPDPDYIHSEISSFSETAFLQ